MRWIDPQQMTEGEFTSLCSGGEPGGWTAVDIAEKLLAGSWLAFAVPNGVFAVEKLGTRLHVRALAIKSFGWSMRRFRDDMDRLAGDMACDTVETVCFNERLARAMVKIRARPESWSMVWQVEGGAQPLMKGEGHGF